jgi:hypothetical protein
MKKILIMVVISLVALMGTASAYQAVLYNADGTVINEENPIQLQPGTSVTLSYYATGILPSEAYEDFPYTIVAKAVRAGSPASASADDIVVVLNKASFNPAGSSSFMDVAAITIVMNEDAPIGARYYVEIGAGDSSDPETATTEFQTVSRTIESIPEFPTIALPIAAILGLAFIMQRRKEE